jgi:predicted ferric reductase
MWAAMAFGERLVFVCYVLMNVAFLVISSFVYAAAQRTYVLCFGFLCAVTFAIVLLPISRTSIWLYAFGISFERAVKWHRIFVLVVSISLLVHGITMSLQYSTTHLFTKIETTEGYGNLYGVLSAIFLGPVIAFAIEPIRRRFFEVFYYAHQLFFIGMIFAFLHSKTAFWLGIGPLALHAIDRAVRFYRGRKAVTLVNARVLPAGGSSSRVVTELRVNVPSGFKYRAGDYAFINIRSISGVDWHPFSISSDPTDPNGDVTFHIMFNGDDSGSFTARVAQWAQQTVPQLFHPSSPGLAEGEVSIDGPYGSLSLRNYEAEYSHLVLVAGGVGVTPMISTLQELRSLHKQGSLNHVRQVHFVWVNSTADPVYHWYGWHLCIECTSSLFSFHL